MKAAKMGQAGFTLMELMIVVVILSILAAMVYPSYQDSVRKSRRSEAKAALSALAARQEQYYTDNKAYTATLSDLGIPSNKTESTFYTLSMATPTSQSFVLTATADPTSIQGGDTNCLTMTLNNVGTKAPAGCW